MTSFTRSSDRLAAGFVLLTTLGLLVVVLVAHRTPLYGVETDLLGDSMPAARALRAGHISRGTFALRGPGYPILLALVSSLTRGEEFLAARIVNVVAAGIAAGAAFLLFRGFLGSRQGAVVMIAMVANPVFVCASLEAGTDMPALALALVATWLVIRRGGWPSCAGSGFVAGLACLTRPNMLFLAPAALATLLMARSDSRRLVAYAVGIAIPLGAWTAAHLALTGAPPRDLNFVNLAYEVYGQSVGYQRFRLQTEGQFGSFFDVIRIDPLRFALHVGRTVATRWTEDAHRLMPAWIGALAVPGMVLAWWRRPAWAAFSIHFVLAYLLLALVFYVPRYFLYLIPFYLSGTFGLVLHTWLAPASAAGPATNTPSRWVPVVRACIALALVASSAVAAMTEGRRILADPPEETRVAGELLRHLGRPAERIMARKPHVAYFARMGYVPIPHAEALTDFLGAARKTGADYLFISAMESGQLPQLSVLIDPGVALPGLLPIAHQVLGGAHFFALYRLTATDAPVAVIQDSLLVAIRQFAARRPGEGWPQGYLGGQLVSMGRYRDALEPLALAERLSPQDALVARFQARAYAELGENDQAASACLRALRLVGEGAWERGYIGEIRIAQERYAEAREELKRAMRGDPGNPRYPAQYLLACGRGGYWNDAATTAERILRITPGDASARLIGARAWLALGRQDRARTVLSIAGSVFGPDSAAVLALRDSIGRGPR